MLINTGSFFTEEFKIVFQIIYPILYVACIKLLSMAAHVKKWWTESNSMSVVVKVMCDMVNSSSLILQPFQHDAFDEGSMLGNKSQVKVKMINYTI